MSTPPLTAFMLALVVPYSSGVQQPVRATAVLSRRLHTRRAAPVEREQARASSLHPEASQASGHLWARSKKHGQIRSDTPAKSRAADQRV